jgi:hypothetical protein
MSNPFGSSPVIAVGADPRGESGPDITSDAFFPTISPADFRECMRLDGTVTESRIRAALIDAIFSVNDSLVRFRSIAEGHGLTIMADTSPDRIDGTSANVHRYRRAVYCLAAASICERYRGTDATGAGNQKADLVESPIADLRRDAFWAIADIRGQRRTVVELI